MKWDGACLPIWRSLKTLEASYAENDLIQFPREVYQKRPIVSDMTDL
jgi:hypothetical protein